MLKKVTTKDIELIKKYLKIANYKSSNYNIVGMFLWLDDYPLYYLEKDNALFLFVIKADIFYSYAPLTSPDNFINSIKNLKEIFAIQGKEFKICYLPTNEKGKMERELENYFVFETTRDQSDYVYEADKLMNYPGRKMQKKRNNYNYFVKNYAGRYEFRELNGNHCHECNELIKKWIATKEDNPSLDSEHQGIIRMLNYYEILDMKIGGVFIDGVLEGFSICTMLNNECVQTNVEKANGEIRGLYQYLVSTMLKTFYPNAKLVNREDDVGIEMLRKSKESYYPDEYWDVYSCKEMR